MEEGREHKIILENRERLTVSAVDDVESFDEEKVVIATEMGTMTVTGSGFRISKLDVEAGQLIIEGDIDEIQYNDIARDNKSGGFFGKLFK